MKKILSLTLAVLLSFSAVAYAADLPASEDPVIYSVKDLSSENLDTIEITQSDIDEGNWNVDALGDVAPIVYEDFPMEMEKYITEGATLNIVFKYLKTVPENGTASFTVTDRMTNEVYYTTELNADNYIIELNALPLDKVYNVRISESFDGTEKNYDGVIQTYRTAADMPYNVYIGENTNINENIIAEYVTIAESVITEDFVKVDENGNEIIYSYAPDVEKTTVTPENLASLYNSLEDNKLYCIQTDAPVDGISEHFMGYFSTTPELESYGIFEPAYKFQLARDYSDVMPLAATSAHPWVTASYLLENAYKFTYLHDESFTLPKTNENEDDFQIISFKFPETGEYTIRTYGTIATSAEYWTVASSSEATPTFSRVIQGNDSNFTQTISILAGQTRYWVIYFDSASSGKSTISITYNDASDRINSVSQLEEGTNNKIAVNTVYSECIDYRGDVDAYYIDNAISGTHAY